MLTKIEVFRVAGPVSLVIPVDVAVQDYFQVLVDTNGWLLLKHANQSAIGRQGRNEQDWVMARVVDKKADGNFVIQISSHYRSAKATAAKAAQIAKEQLTATEQEGGVEVDI